jgi:Protein of unknown function (DUF3995)
MLLGLLEALILAAIGVLHVYWAFGGRWGSDIVVPKLEARPDQNVFTPTPIATLVIAALLLIAAIIVLERSGWTANLLPAWVTTLGIWALAFVFAARSIGDFRYVGWFKRVRDTRFATADTRAFTPLTTLLSLSSLLLASS